MSCYFKSKKFRVDVTLPHQTWIFNVNHRRYKRQKFEKEYLEKFNMTITGEDLDLDDVTKKRPLEHPEYDGIECKKMRDSL